jgi:anti-sigma regulatory factor (Ser/Thr protein kinase)
MSDAFDTTFLIADGVEADRHALASIARRLARATDHSQDVAAKFALATAELASNLARHGGGGSLRLCATTEQLVIETRNRAGRGWLGGESRGYGLEAVRRVMDAVELVERDGTLMVIARWRAPDATRRD